MDGEDQKDIIKKEKTYSIEQAISEIDDIVENVLESFKKKV